MLTIKLPTTTSAQLWGTRRVVGVDIDDAQVRMAWRRRCTLWSHQAPPPLPEPASSCASGSTTSRLNLKCKRAPQPHPPPAPPEADYFPVPGTGKMATVHAVVKELKHMAEQNVRSFVYSTRRINLTRARIGDKPIHIRRDKCAADT